eukprot:c24377_g3_i1 orf=446-1780(-)
MERSSEDTRFAVFDFEEDLFLDPIDIFGVEAPPLLKVPPCCKQGEEEAEEESPLLKPPAAFQVKEEPKDEAAVESALLALPAACQVKEEAREEAATACAAAPSAHRVAPHISDKLQHCVNIMASKVEQLQREVLQATRACSILRRAKLQRITPLKDRDAGSFGNKKPRLFDAARTEAVKRKKISDLLRLCGNILRQLMQHRWAWPFVQPVDVEGLQLHDYYKIIRRPMDLGTIRTRLEAKDGTGYRHVREFCEDVRLVFRNAMLYNESWTEVHLMAKALLQKFEDRWKISIEPRLLEEEEKLYEDQQDSYLLDIAELHAKEEQAAEQLRKEVVFQLTDIDSKLEGFLMQVLSKCGAMGVQEKKDLYTRLHKLPPASLSRVVEIVSARNIREATTDNIFVDLEGLDSSTLWRLHFFVKMLTDSAQEQAEKTVESKSHTGGLSHAI